MSPPAGFYVGIGPPMLVFCFSAGGFSLLRITQPRGSLLRGTTGSGRCNIPTNRRPKAMTVADENPFKQEADERRAVFKGRHGYPAQLVPDVWVGRLVAMNIVSPTRASGMLEAVKAEGYVVSVEDRVVFIPRQSVLQLELYNPDDLEIDDLEIGI